jgi:transcriptional regulator with XRE-family HTH domain
MNADPLDELIGIDRTRPLTQHAAHLVQAHQRLMDDLIAVRRSAGLTTEEVGRRMGVTAYVVSKLERADADPCLSTLRRYALAIGATITHEVANAPEATSETSTS